MFNPNEESSLLIQVAANQPSIIDHINMKFPIHKITRSSFIWGLGGQIAVYYKGMECFSNIE